MITNKDLPNKFTMYDGNHIIFVNKQDKKCFRDAGEVDYLIKIDAVGEALLSDSILLYLLNIGKWKVVE